MKTQFKALFSALPPFVKFFWIFMGALPMLVGVLGTSYSAYLALTPESIHPALPPDFAGSWGNLLNGLVITAATGLFGVFRLRAQRARERLVRVGQRIDPPIARIEESLLQRKNGGRNYYIYSNWQDPATGKRYTFESERLERDPSLHLRRGDTLPIYLEPGDPTKYYFDVSSLPKPKGFFG